MNEVTDYESVGITVSLTQSRTRIVITFPQPSIVVGISSTNHVGELRINFKRRERVGGKMKWVRVRRDVDPGDFRGRGPVPIDLDFGMSTEISLMIKQLGEPVGNHLHLNFWVKPR